MEKDKQTIKDADPKEKTSKNDDCKCSKDCGCCEKRKESKAVVQPKVVVIASMLLLSLSSAFGQAQGTQPFWSDPFNSPMLPLYLTLAFVVITIILLVVVILYLLKVLNIFVAQAVQERTTRLGIIPKKELSWWQKFRDKINATVPLEKEKDIDTGHDFDGIRELDNHLPPWWTGLFYATIIWAIGYLVVYHVADTLPLSLGEYQNELSEAENNARILRASRPVEAIDENTLEYSTDAAIQANGKLVFNSSNCGSCHRADGGGNAIGPNLTDEYWLHGGSVRHVYSTIKNGFVEKGMPAWGKVMSPKDVRDVAFFVMSLKGSNPAQAKAPQGELYKEEVKQAPGDSTKTQAMNR